jgi:hypothetical protein
MRRSMLAGAILSAAMTAVPTAYANVQEFHTKFSGFLAIGALGSETGAILSKGEGTLKLMLDKQLQSITFALTYTGMETAVQQAHIHFGKVHVAGGIIVFLCSNVGSGPPGTQLCPPNGGLDCAQWQCLMWLLPSHATPTAGVEVTVGNDPGPLSP